MVHRGRIAIIVLICILIMLPVGILGYQYGLRPRLSAVRVVDIQASLPELGGFQPNAIEVAAGETVTLRFHSTDVVHGIAIGPGLGIDLGDVDPGQVKEVTLKFSEAGTYTFYCNTWCSPNHWRMRGVVEVIDARQDNAQPTPQVDPVIQGLITEGIDIDANVMADGMAAPSAPALPVHPSASRGGTLLA